MDALSQLSYGPGTYRSLLRGLGAVQRGDPADLEARFGGEDVAHEGSGLCPEPPRESGVGRAARKDEERLATLFFPGQDEAREIAAVVSQRRHDDVAVDDRAESDVGNLDGDDRSRWNDRTDAVE